MNQHKEKVLSVPAGGTLELIVTYYIHAFPESRSYAYQDSKYITFRQRNGGNMTTVYTINKKFHLSPTGSQLIEGQEYLTPSEEQRVKDYIEARKAGFGFEENTNYTFMILSETEKIELLHAPHPETNKTGPRYYWLKDLQDGNSVVKTISNQETYTNWLISASEKVFDVTSAFATSDYVDWRQSGKFQVGDTIYIYVSSPVQKVKFKTVVEKIDIPFVETYDSKEFWTKDEFHIESQSKKFARLRLVTKSDSEFLSLENLLQNGLSSYPQGPRRVNEELKAYLDNYLEEDKMTQSFPDQINEQYQEGHAYKVLVNKYERNLEARQKCIEIYGYSCQVCQTNLEEVYGEVAKEFIHVHHLIPLSEIKEEYQVNPANDLLPVCPNCHAMLHRKVNGEYLSIEELKKRMNNQA